jgi:hypothetical protein
MDPLALVESIDVVPLFPETFLQIIVSKVWKEKAELLSTCNDVLAKNPKVKDVPALSEIVSALGARMADTNVNVVGASAGMIGALANQVEGKGFGKYKSAVVPPILDRLKEKKTMDALGKALDAVFETVSLRSSGGE